MEAPRSRRLSPLHQPAGGASGGACPRRPSPTKTPLLPQTFSDDHNETMGEDKKSGRAIQVTWVLLFAMAGTLLFTILLSLKAHFNQAVLQAQSLSSDIITPSSGYKGWMKNRTSDLLQQQLLLQAKANSGVGGTCICLIDSLSFISQSRVF